MKIVYMGTPKFAIAPLDKLLKNNYNISAVVTTPDAPKGRGLQIRPSPIKSFATSKGLQVLQYDNLKNPDFINTLKEISPDIIIVVAFKILPPEVYSLAKLGAFNLHASLLPAYRGAAPINRAIINGETQTGVTTFFLQDKVDTGYIILQRSIDILSDDNYGTLYDKLSSLGADVTLETVKLIERGNVKTTFQDDSLASSAPKIFKQDCIINWEKESYKIFNLIRGLSPQPAAFTHLHNKSIKIYKAGMTDIRASKPAGTLLVKDKRLFVHCSDYLLEIFELQIEGKKTSTAVDFINGYHFKNDDVCFS